MLSSPSYIQSPSQYQPASQVQFQGLGTFAKELKTRVKKRIFEGEQ